MDRQITLFRIKNCLEKETLVLLENKKVKTFLSLSKRNREESHRINNVKSKNLRSEAKTHKI